LIESVLEALRNVFDTLDFLACPACGVVGDFVRESTVSMAGCVSSGRRSKLEMDGRGEETGGRRTILNIIHTGIEFALDIAPSIIDVFINAIFVVFVVVVFSRNRAIVRLPALHN